MRTPTLKPGKSETLTVIVPAYDAASTIVACLEALAAAGVAGVDVVVVDDGSRDATAALSRARGATVEATAGRTGAGAARNLGVRRSAGDLLIFVDADVCVAPDAVARIEAAFTADPGLAALFGSYDDAPPAPGLVSRTRNLLHHHVHQTGGREAASFWTGLGAVRRDAFEAVGGFAADQRMMEDVRFGRELWRRGHRIELRPEIQGAHLKRWSLRSMLRTDLLDRAIPWSRLILAPGAVNPPGGLNVSAAAKMSVVAVFVLLLAAILGIGFAVAGVAAGFAAAAFAAAAASGCLAWLNRAFLGLVARRLGRIAAVQAVWILALHYTMSGMGFAWVMAERTLGGLRRASAG